MLHSGSHQFKVTLQGSTTGVSEHVIGIFRGIIIPKGILMGVCTNPMGYPYHEKGDFWGLLAMPELTLMNLWCVQHKKQLQDLYEKYGVDEGDRFKGLFRYCMGNSIHCPWAEMVEEILNESDLYFVNEIPAQLKRKFFGLEKQAE